MAAHISTCSSKSNGMHRQLMGYEMEMVHALNRHCMNTQQELFGIYFILLGHNDQSEKKWIANLAIHVHVQLDFGQLTVIIFIPGKACFGILTRVHLYLHAGRHFRSLSTN